MTEIYILCWNVNGIRAVQKKGFLPWLCQTSPDILCLQEVKAQADQLPADIQQPSGYHAHWNFPVRRGYSGVATLTKREPAMVQNGLGIDRFDVEGRVVTARYPWFTLINVYFPNGKASQERLDYKMDFYDAFLDFVEPLRAGGRGLIVCGDFNTAHKEIDLARPRENEDVSGFLPVEREWMDSFVARGFVDVFRHFNREPHHYTWWSMRTRARERNIGWRLDYFFVTGDLLDSVTEASILPDVMGSDHCPVSLRLRL